MAKFAELPESGLRKHIFYTLGGYPCLGQIDSATCPLTPALEHPCQMWCMSRATPP